jgi:branched-chain amino acid transport system permease protein
MSTARWAKVAALAAGIGGVVAAPYVLPSYVVSLLTLVFISALLAGSVNLLAGLAGLVSIGHAGIAAAAAYGVAWAAVHDLGLAAELGVAAAITFAVSVVYALTTMRTAGIVFLMITLALGIVVYGIALKVSTITGGQNGLTGIRRPELIADPRAFLLLAAAAFGVASAFRWVLGRSPFGLVLRGTRESESRMSSLGYSVAQAKFVAVLLSGILAGAAGVLIVWQAEFMSPNVASFGRSAMAVVMVILGGTGTLLGPLVGAGIVVGTEHWLSSYIERWPTLLGLVFIAVVLFAPGGIVGALSRVRFPGGHARRATAAPDGQAATPPLLDTHPQRTEAGGRPPDPE